MQASRRHPTCCTLERLPAAPSPAPALAPTVPLCSLAGAGGAACEGGHDRPEALVGLTALVVKQVVLNLEGGQGEGGGPVREGQCANKDDVDAVGSTL